MAGVNRGVEPVELSPEQIKLYTELVKSIVVDAYRFGWQDFWQQELTDEESDQLGSQGREVFTRSLFPQTGRKFGHGCMSTYKRNGRLLMKIGLCVPVDFDGEAWTNNSVAPLDMFTRNYEDIANFLIAERTWQTIPLGQIAGTYFDLNENLLEPPPILVRGDQQREMMRLFCTAGFAREKDRWFYWTCADIENVLDHGTYFWRGVEDGGLPTLI